MPETEEVRGQYPGGCGAPGKETLVEEFESLKKLLIEAEEDIKKAEGGNKAAGTRARAAMQDVKNTAQVVRQKILELRGGDSKEEGGGAKGG